jgi:hypothetical protein
VKNSRAQKFEFRVEREQEIALGLKGFIGK